MACSIRRLAFVLVALLCLSQAAFADLYLSSGQYRFTVRVENSWFKDVQQAHGNVWVSGSQARIEIQAAGYRNSFEYVYLNPNTTNYYVRVRMEEPSIRAEVRFDDNQPVQGSSVDNWSQSMYWGDEYGIRAQFPKEGLTQLSERQIEVRVNGMWAFAPRLYLVDRGTTWSLEAVVKRRDMQSFMNTITVMVKRDPAPAPAPTVADVRDLAADYADNLKLANKGLQGESLRTVADRLESLARRIRCGFAGLDADGRREIRDVVVRGPLAVELDQVERFQALHRD